MKRLLVGAGALVLGGGLFLAPNALAEDVGTPVGTVSADGDPATQSGHVYADGNGANGAPSGYIGVNSEEGVVGCWTGTYSEGSNNVITAIPPAVPPAQPNPNSPCTPAP